MRGGAAVPGPRAAATGQAGRPQPPSDHGPSRRLHCTCTECTTPNTRPCSQCTTCLPPSSDLSNSLWPLSSLCPVSCTLTCGFLLPAYTASTRRAFPALYHHPFSFLFPIAPASSSALIASALLACCPTHRARGGSLPLALPSSSSPSECWFLIAAPDNAMPMCFVLHRRQHLWHPRL